MAWYGDQSSTPLTIALTGASAGGILLLPSLVALESRIGFRQTLLTLAFIELLVVGGLALLVIRTPDRPRPGDERPGTAWALMGNRQFWLLASGLAVMISVQVGVLVHHLNLLTEVVSEGVGASIVVLTTMAALTGRIGFIAAHGHFGAERTGLAFVLLQIGSLVFLSVSPHERMTLTIGSAWFGLSVGVLITLPPLMTRSTFASHDFSATFPMINAIYQVGVALGAPALAALHGVLGGYRPALGVFAALELAAAMLLYVNQRHPHSTAAS